MSYASDRQRASFEWAEREHERILRAGPPEPHTEDVTVKYMVAVRWDQEVSILTKVLGGEASFAADPIDDVYRVAQGSTVVEDVESYDEAEEIVKDLMREHLYDFVDIDSLLVTAERIEPDEPDWDAITKDSRIEEEDER